MAFDSILLAQIIGPFFAILGLAVLLNAKTLQKLTVEIKNHQLLLFHGGALNLLLGLLLVSGHNTWVQGWPVIITIFAWAMILKGVCLLLFPSSTQKIATKWSSGSHYNLCGLVMLVLGGYLCYVSWCPLLWG